MTANLGSTVKYLERLSKAVPCNKQDAIKAGVSGIFYLMLHKKILQHTSNFLHWDVKWLAKDRIPEEDGQKICIFSVCFQIATE